jgi:hypothetical protein
MKIRSERARSWQWVLVETVAAVALAAIAVFARASIERSFDAAIDADGHWLAATFAFELLSIMIFARTQRIILRDQPCCRLAVRRELGPGEVGVLLKGSLLLFGAGVRH